jgi:hypothetical protein
MTLVVTCVIVGMYKPCSQCFKRTINFLHCFFSSSLWKTSCQFIILSTCVQNKSKQTEKGGVNRDESLTCYNQRHWRYYLLSTSSDVRRSPSDMFRGVLNTKNQLCSRSNMVEMVCLLHWYCNGKYKYRHRRTLLQFVFELFILQLFRRPFSV